MLSRYIYKHYGIKLSRDQLKKLLNMIHTVNAEMDRVEIKDNGEDIKIGNANGSSEGNAGNGCCDFSVNTGFLKSISDRILNQQGELGQMSAGIASVRAKLDLHYAGLVNAMMEQEQQIEKYGKCCGRLGKSLREI